MREYVLRSVNASLTLSLAATSVREGLGFWQGRDGHVLPLTRATEGASIIALAVDARARAFKSLSRGMLPPLR